MYRLEQGAKDPVDSHHPLSAPTFVAQQCAYQLTDCVPKQMTPAYSYIAPLACISHHRSMSMLRRPSNLDATSLLVLDDDLHVLAGRNGLKGIGRFCQRERLGDELLDVDDTAREQIDRGREARGGVSRHACASAHAPARFGLHHSPLTSSSLFVTARVGKTFVWM